MDPATLSLDHRSFKLEGELHRECANRVIEWAGKSVMPFEPPTLNGLNKRALKCGSLKRFKTNRQMLSLP